MEAALQDLIANKPKDSIPLVVLMCGLAGSGKTTFAQHLEAAGFIRLSIDEEIWATRGRYGLDYPAEQYPQFQREAEAILRHRLRKLIHLDESVVVDFSFWQRSRREEYKQLVEEEGGRWKLIYLKTSPELLRQRLDSRAPRFDANAAFPITQTILEGYVGGFEAPVGEGEIVVEVD